MMRGREESFGVMPGEFEDTGEQKGEESRALAHHQGNMFVSASQRKSKERRGEAGGGERQVGRKV